MPERHARATPWLHSFWTGSCRCYWEAFESGLCARDETLGEDEVVCLLGRVIADSQAAQLFGQLAVFEVRGYRRRGRSDHYSVPATVPSTFATPDRHENVYRLENNTIGLANNVRLP
jgi:hypothetical protein